MEYSKLDRAPLTGIVTYELKGTINKMTPYLLTILIGSLVGGPIGLVIANLLHLGVPLTIITEIISIISAITTNNLIRKSYCFYQIQMQFNVDVGQPPLETLIELNSCFNKISIDTNIGDGDGNGGDNLQLKHSVTKLIKLLETDNWLSGWYHALLNQFYKAKLTNFYFYLPNYRQKINNDNIFLVKDTLSKMVNGLLKLLLVAEGKQQIEKERVVLIYSICEHILMSSIFNELWKMARYTNNKKEKQYLKKVINYPLEISIESDIINCLNQLIKRPTASYRINILKKTCDLISNHQYIGCDNLLIGFVNYLAASDIKYPFSELVVMETLLPSELKGEEAYLMATFYASAQYIVDYVSN